MVGSAMKTLLFHGKTVFHGIRDSRSGREGRERESVLTGKERPRHLSPEGTPGRAGSDEDGHPTTPPPHHSITPSPHHTITSRR